VKNPKKLELALAVLLALFVGLWAIRAYNAHRFHFEQQTRVMMDTYITISAIGPQRATMAAINKAFDRMLEVDIKFNCFNPKSPIYAFNHQGVSISDPEIIKVVRVALELSKKSDGAFDITILPVSQLWGFPTKSFHLPTGQEIKEALEKVGYQHLLFEDGNLVKDQEDVSIDLGAIAKGYAVGEAAKVLRSQGITSAIVQAGGDTYALGRKGKRPWTVGIRDPFGKSQEDLLGYVEIEDLTIMGSGDYERFFIKDGKKYHHIFDAKTGFPAEGSSGVFVISPDPMMSDGLATTLFVLGPEKGMKILEEIPNTEAIMVMPSEKKLYTPGLKDALKAVPKGGKK
jgi:thiamine biosynthesis lipoprotein